MDHDFNHNERGQSLVLIAVIMVVLLMLAALAIDGGFALSNRRKAQNAADAGALAGANALCVGRTTSVVKAQASDYATRNGAAPIPIVTVGEKTVTVDTTISQNTFLAGIFGSNVINTSATASAGCYAPCEGTGILPIAWSCHPPAGETGTNECGTITGTLDHPGPTYIIMDSDKTTEDLYCQNPITHLPSGAMDCDLNNDGVNDVTRLGTDGNRSWLSFDGSNGKLKEWIHGYTGQVSIHTWFGGVPGNRDSVYQEAVTIENHIVLIPVYNDICPGNPSNKCPSSIHTNPPDPWNDIIINDAKSTDYYHVIQFSAFMVTCVSAKPSDFCPGKADAMKINKNIKNNMNTIEGYFITDYFGSGKCNGPDTGVYTIYLNH